MAKQKFKQITTPRGALKFPHLTRPDTKYVKEGEYHTKLILEGEAAEELKDAFTPLLEEWKAEQIANLKKAKKIADARKVTIFEPWVAEEDEETGEETGRTVFGTFKLRAKVLDKETGKVRFTQSVAVFLPGRPRQAATAEQLQDSPVWGGSVAALSVQLVPYYIPKDKVVGFTLRLRAAKVYELSGGGDRDASSYGFDDDDDCDDDVPFDADAPDNDGDGDPGDDF